MHQSHNLSGTHLLSGEYKYETRQGIKFMLFVMVIIITGLILSMLTYPYSIRLLTTREFDENAWAIVLLLSGLSFILFLAFIILFFISLYQFQRGRFEFGEKHVNDIKWVKIFIITYIILFFISSYALTLLALFSIFSSFYIVPSIIQVISILQNFFISFSILLMVRSFAGDREKDILYIFTGLMILLPIIRLTLELGYATAFQNLDLFGNIIYQEIILFVTLFLWLLAAIAYYLTCKSSELVCRCDFLVNIIVSIQLLAR